MGGETQKIGEIGENTACLFLKKHNFMIVERNYRKKWGEIDIIAEKRGILHFVEVKTVSRENLDNVIRETVGTDSHRPEDNIHPWKLKRLSRAIQTYLLEKNIDENKEWQFDVVAVFLDRKKREARCRYMENVVL